MTRQDHKYVNLPRQLVEVVDTCVTAILSNGAQVYANRKDFVIKSVIQQIENEKTVNRSLARKIDAKEQLETLTQRSKIKGGNRSKNAY